MAQQTVTIYGSGSAVLNQDSPNANDTTQIEIDVGDRIHGCEQFYLPETIIGKRIVSVTLYIYARTGTGHGTIANLSGVKAIAEPWEPSQTTYNNRPDIFGEELRDGFNWTGLSSTYGWKSFQMPTSTADIDVAWNLVSHGFWTGQYVKYQTSNSSNKPYAEVTCADDNAGLYPTNLRPTGGFVNNKTGANLYWSTAVKEGTIGEPALAQTVITWQYGDTTQTATVTGAGTSYTIPPEQLPESGTVTWSVQTTDSAGNVAASSTMSFTTTDSTGTATPVSPINEYVDGTESVSLVWDWNINTGTAATKADFQVSSNGGSSWTTLGSVDGEVPYVAAPGTLPDGNVLWQVRGYNSDGVAGPWSSSANIVVRQAPAAPILESATPVPKPTVTWQSAGQQAYQLQAGDWDSGPVFGTAKSAQVEEFLPAGQTTIRLRVQNSFGLWSPWAEITVTIVNTPGEVITAEAQPVQGGVQISWSTEGEYPAYYVYRDGDLIGTTELPPFADYRALGEHEYFVRGINADSTYTQSNTVSAETSPRWGLIAVDGEWNWLELRYMRGSFVTLSDNRQANVSYAYYSGRSLPVAEISGTRSRQMSVTYSLRKTDLDTLYGMLGQLVVYKDRRTICRGILDSVAITADWCSDASLTITEVDDGT